MEITGLCETMFRPDSRSKREHSVRKFSNTYPSRFRQISTIFRYARYFSSIHVNSTMVARDPLTLWNLCSQVRYHNVVRGILSVPRRCDRPAFLDRVHEFGAEPVDLRVLQPRLPRSFQEYSAVRVLLALQTRAVRSRGARFPSAVPKVRSGLTRRGTHYNSIAFSSPPSFLFFVHFPESPIELEFSFRPRTPGTTSGAWFFINEWLREWVNLIYRFVRLLDSRNSCSLRHIRVRFSRELFCRKCRGKEGRIRLIL